MFIHQDEDYSITNMIYIIKACAHTEVCLIVWSGVLRSYFERSMESYTDRCYSAVGVLQCGFSLVVS
jgi:hypothetical protein